MQGALKEAQPVPQECDAGEVLGRVVVSAQDTCRRVGVTLELPEQLAASSHSLAPAPHRTEASLAGSKAALPSHVTQKPSLQSRDSTANSSTSAVRRAPALLPPPSRVALAKQRRPAMTGLKANVNSEVSSSVQKEHCARMP